MQITADSVSKWSNMHCKAAGVTHNQCMQSHALIYTYRSTWQISIRAICMRYFYTKYLILYSDGFIHV